jgi:hypothetical protein
VPVVAGISGLAVVGVSDVDVLLFCFCFVDAVASTTALPVLLRVF